MTDGCGVPGTRKREGSCVLYQYPVPVVAVYARCMRVPGAGSRCNLLFIQCRFDRGGQ